MNALVEAPATNHPVSGNALVPTDMRSAMDLAHMMSEAKLVPSHLHGKPGDCLMVIEQAMRWSMSPFAVAQCTSVIQGRMMFEGKLVAAAVQASGVLSHRLSYEFEGSGATRKVIASATIRGETKPRTIECTFAEAKTSNGMWVKQPDQQLVYFSTRAWARRHTPEVMLGVYSPEDFDNQPRQQEYSGQTIDLDATVPGRPDNVSELRKALANQRAGQVTHEQAAESDPVDDARPLDEALTTGKAMDDRVAEAVRKATALPDTTNAASWIARATAALETDNGIGARWMKALSYAVTNCPTIADLATLNQHPIVLRNMTDAPPQARTDIAAMFLDAAQRLGTAEEAQEGEAA